MLYRAYNLLIQTSVVSFQLCHLILRHISSHHSSTAADCNCNVAQCAQVAHHVIVADAVSKAVVAQRIVYGVCCRRITLSPGSACSQCIQALECLRIELAAAVQCIQALQSSVYILACSGSVHALDPCILCIDLIHVAVNGLLAVCQLGLQNLLQLSRGLIGDCVLYNCSCFIILATDVLVQICSPAVAEQGIACTVFIGEQVCSRDLVAVVQAAQIQINGNRALNAESAEVQRSHVGSCACTQGGFNLLCKTCVSLVCDQCAALSQLEVYFIGFYAGSCHYTGLQIVQDGISQGLVSAVSENAGVALQQILCNRSAYGNSAANFRCILLVQGVQSQSPFRTLRVCIRSNVCEALDGDSGIRSICCKICHSRSRKHTLCENQAGAEHGCHTSLEECLFHLFTSLPLFNVFRCFMHVLHESVAHIPAAV